MVSHGSGQWVGQARGDVLHYRRQRAEARALLERCGNGPPTAALTRGGTAEPSSDDDERDPFDEDSDAEAPTGVRAPPGGPALGGNAGLGGLTLAVNGLLSGMGSACAGVDAEHGGRDGFLAGIEDEDEDEDEDDAGGAEAQLSEEQAHALRELARVLMRSRLRCSANRSLEAALLLADALQLFLAHEAEEKQDATALVRGARELSSGSEDEDEWHLEEDSEEDDEWWQEGDGWESERSDSGEDLAAGHTAHRHGSALWWGSTVDVAATANSLALLLHTSPGLREQLAALGALSEARWAPANLLRLAIRKLGWARHQQSALLHHARCTLAWVLDANVGAIVDGGDGYAHALREKAMRDSADPELPAKLWEHYVEELGVIHAELARPSQQRLERQLALDRAMVPMPVPVPAPAADSNAV
eukprot:g3744.t1